MKFDGDLYEEGKEASTKGFYLTPGQHLVRLRNPRQEPAKKSGAPMFLLDMQVKQGADKGFIHTERFVLNNKWGVARLLKLLDILKISHSRGKFDEEELDGKMVIIHTSMRTTEQGGEFVDVKRYIDAAEADGWGDPDSKPAKKAAPKDEDEDDDDPDEDEDEPKKRKKKPVDEDEDDSDEDDDDKPKKKAKKKSKKDDDDDDVGF